MKPIISGFMFFDDIEQLPNAGGAPGASLHLINPQNVIRPQFIPSGYSFAVAFSLLQIDPKKEHILSFKFRNPKGEYVLNAENINVAKNSAFDDNLPKEAAGLMFNFNFRNVPLTEEGVYVGLVYVDDELIGEFPLHVYAQRRPK